MDKVSVRYAQALFEIATQNDSLIEFKTQAQFIKTILKENPEFVQLFEKTQLLIDEKKVLIQTVFGTQIDEMLVNLMCLLIDKKRMNLAQSIFLDFIHLANQSLAIEEGIVYSIRPLAKEDIVQLEAQLSLKHKIKIELTNKIDPSLISGLKIKFKESVIDASLSAQLEALRETLREGRS